MYRALILWMSSLKLMVRVDTLGCLRWPTGANPLRSTSMSGTGKRESRYGSSRSLPRYLIPPIFYRPSPSLTFFKVLGEPIDPPTRSSTLTATKTPTPPASTNERPHPQDIEWISEIVQGGRPGSRRPLVHGRGAAAPSRPPREVRSTNSVPLPPSRRMSIPKSPRRRKDPKGQASNSPQNGGRANTAPNKNSNTNQRGLRNEKTEKRAEGSLEGISTSEAASVLLQIHEFRSNNP